MFSSANSDHAQKYLARVVPWPQEGEAPVFVNVQWTFKPKDHNGGNRYPWSGRAARSVSEAINAIEYALKSADTRDVYLCMSTQREAEEKQGRNNFKYFKPIRNQANAVALKSLFIDIDLKGGDHGYSTVDELTTALVKFLQDTGMPRPSMMVSTGGGYHVYWTMARALSPVEWAPLAFALAEATKRHGLKCDTQCTIDSARVLRIPNTFNRKLADARPVKLMGTPLEFDYAVERLAAVLEPYKTTVPSNHSAGFLENPALFPLREPLVGDDLSSGIESTKVGPIDIKGVLPECAFLRNAVTSGGNTLTNPLWNLTTLTATFLEDGRTMAHLMGRKHPGYTRESTDELYDRKDREKQQKGLGWPSCRTISATGSTACQACPHFAKGKSPLHFAPRPQPTPPASRPTANPPGAPVNVPPAVINDLPKTYQRGTDGIISKQFNEEDGTTAWAPICDYPMTKPWLQKGASWILNFETVTDQVQQISLPCEAINTNEMRKILQGQGFVPQNHHMRALGDFFVSWIGQLKTTKNAVISTTPFGWNVKGNQIEGFVYGGQVWTPTGSRTAPNPDPVTAVQYAPTGDIKPWMTAAALVTSQGRPALDAIMASSFAAPLVRFTGHPGLMMSVYSIESGIGKSTALKVAQAVWGDPIRAMQSLNDTSNSVMNKIGEIRSLPLYWDELKTEDDTRRFVNNVFQMSLGKEKSRLGQNAKQRTVGTWQTMLVSASNESLVDFVTSRTKMTTAGLYRVFEYAVEPGVNGQIPVSEASRAISRLNDNFGQVGLLYAQFLGANFVRLDKEVGEFQKQLDEEIKAATDERFWTALIATLCMGARYSNELGFTAIPEPALRKFLLGVLAEMRQLRNDQPVDMKDEMNVSNVLAQFLNTMRGRHTLVTNKIHVSAGKPQPDAIKIVNDIGRLDGVFVHIGKDDKTLRMSSITLSEWLAEKGYSRHLFTKALADEMGMKTVRGRMGAGTQFANATEYLLEINLNGSKHVNFLDEV